MEGQGLGDGDDAEEGQRKEDQDRRAQLMLFDRIRLRGVEARNRIVVSPMCQYSAQDGHVTDWHLVHLGKFAQGGAGIVFVEATAVERRGRITHGDTGIWDDAHIPGLQKLSSFLKQNGALPAIQLAHAGRKASMAPLVRQRSARRRGFQARRQALEHGSAHRSIDRRRVDRAARLQARRLRGGAQRIPGGGTPRACRRLRDPRNPCRTRLPAPYVPLPAIQSS
jgi:hypothetical protein